MNPTLKAAIEEDAKRIQENPPPFIPYLPAPDPQPARLTPVL